MDDRKKFRWMEKWKKGCMETIFFQSKTQNNFALLVVFAFDYFFSPSLNLFPVRASEDLMSDQIKPPGLRLAIENHH